MRAWFCGLWYAVCVAEAHDIKATASVPEDTVVASASEEEEASSVKEAVQTDSLKVPLAPTPLGKKGPLLTTDMVYETADLLQTVYANFLAEHVRRQATSVWNSTDQITAAVLEADPIAQLCLKIGCQKEEVEQDVQAIYRRTRVSASSLSALAVRTSGHIQEHLADWTHVAVDHFERVMPKYEGLIPRTTGNLALFVLYLIAVLYLLLRAVGLALRLTLFALCCCRGSSREAAKPPRLYAQQVPDISRPAWLPFEVPSSTAAKPRARLASEPLQQQHQRPVECCLFGNPMNEIEKWVKG